MKFRDLYKYLNEPTSFVEAEADDLFRIDKLAEISKIIEELNSYFEIIKTFIDSMNKFDQLLECSENLIPNKNSMGTFFENIAKIMDELRKFQEELGCLADGSWRIKIVKMLYQNAISSNDNNNNSGIKRELSSIDSENPTSENLRKVAKK